LVSARLIKLLKLIKVPYLTKKLFHGIAATTEHIPILKSVGKIKTIIDIGANKGQFALAARYVFPEAKIISFEPLSAPAEKFNKLFKNDVNIVLNQVAAGPEKHTLPIHVSKKDDSSSLLPIGSRQSAIFPGTEESHTEEIKVAPLIHYINEEDLVVPIFVKIDVQGYELEVLIGCEELNEFFDYIYVECSFIELYENQALADEVIQYLSKKSFRLKGIYNTYYDKKGVAIQSDFLFKRENSIENY